MVLSKSRRHIHLGILAIGMLLPALGAASFANTTGDPLCGLVFLQPDGKVFLAVPNGDTLDVQQISEAEQRIEYIAVAPNGKCVWALDRQAKSSTVTAEGWRKYGPLTVFVLDPGSRSMAENSLCAMVLSPDGERLAYVAHMKARGVYELHCETMTTGANVTITEPWPYLQMPSWSPDGSKIAYFASTDSDGFRLHVLDMMSRKDIVVSPRSLRMNLSGNIMDEVVWSPDSKLIYFSSRYDGAVDWLGAATYVVPANGDVPPRKIAEGHCRSISSDGGVVAVDNRFLAVGGADVEEVAAPPAMKGSPSHDNKITVYTGQSGGLWCRLLDSGNEIPVSNKWWHDIRSRYFRSWTTLDSPTGK